MSISAVTPTSVFTSATPACIPSENESASLTETVLCSAYATSTCCAPPPPGTGTAVESPPATSTSAADPTVGWIPNAASTSITTPMRHAQAPS